MKLNRIITLILALLASLTGNVYQYTAAPEAAAIPYQHEQPATPPVDDDPRPHLPGDTNPDAQLKTWQVRATFAITYQVKPTSSAFQDGYQVTVYHTDRTPTAVKSKKKPGAESVDWRPMPEDLPGVVSIQVHSVEVTGGKSDES